MKEQGSQAHQMRISINKLEVTLHNRIRGIPYNRNDTPTAQS